MRNLEFSLDRLDARLPEDVYGVVGRERCACRWYNVHLGLQPDRSGRRHGLGPGDVLSDWRAQAASMVRLAPLRTSLDDHEHLGLLLDVEVYNDTAVDLLGNKGAAVA